MATYKEIKGVTVQTLDEDPVENVGSWSSGGALNTGRSENAGVGILTAALSVGGNTSPGATAVVEQYNGTAWTEVGDLNTARRNMGAGGTYTSSIVAGGDTPGSDEVNVVETWDGSSWTETTDLNTARKNLRGAGASNTATVVFGGQIPPNSPGTATDTGVTELWNGSSWTETGDLNTGRHSGAGFGISTAAIMAGGQSNPPDSKQAATEQFNGSSWTEIADISVRSLISGAGTTTSGLVFGGLAPPGSAVATTESWDGSSWTEVNDMATAIYKGAGCGASSSSALSFGGHGYVTTTQEWEFPPATQAKLKEGMIFLSGSTTLKGFGKAAGIPAATWASGADTNTARAYGGGYADHAPQTEAFIYGGSVAGAGPQLAQSENYNGTAWTEVNDLNTARGERGAGSGTFGSAFLAGGQVQGEPAPADEHEQWNGSSWSEATEQNTDRRDYHGNGPSGDSGIIVAGYDGSTYVANTEIWNGSSWTEVADVNTARYANGTIGSTTDSICAGGRTSSYVVVNESWDGSSWSEVADMSTGRQSYTMSGHTSTLGFVASGYKSPAPNYLTNVELWNGSSWTEINDVSTARTGGGGGGTAAAGIMATGNPSSSPNSQTTEEFTADAALSTVTVS